MRWALPLLALLLGCRGDADNLTTTTTIPPSTVTSKGSQSPTDTVGTLSSISTQSSNKIDTNIQPIAQPNANTLIDASNPPPIPSSAPLSSTLPSASGAGSSTVSSNPPNTGTLPAASTPAHTDTSALPPSSTQPPVKLSAPTTKAGATTKALEVAASNTINSADPILSALSSSGAPSDSTSTPDVTTFSSVTAPAAIDITSASRIAAAAAAIGIPSLAGVPTEAGGPASTSSSQKPQTSETIPGVNADKEETTKSAPEASGKTMESTTKPRKTTVATTWQSGISQTPSSSSGSPKTSKSPHHHIPIPTRNPPINQIICGNRNQTQSSDSAVILTLNKSSPCGGPLDESLHNILCKAVKDTFNRSRDNCTVHLSAAGYPADTIAVLGVSVLTSARAEELFKLLEVKKGELHKVGVSNVTYPGMLKAEDDEDRLSTPLIIAIVCMACALLLVAAIYGCCHQRVAHRKDQQRLTEELQTMENGYHDNPTLEVMETGSEMQEKKVNLNGEVGDCWIVPLHNLTKEELEEEDTHL